MTFKPARLSFEMPPLVATLLYNGYTTGMLGTHAWVLNANIQLYGRFCDEPELRLANGIRLELFPQSHLGFYEETGALEVHRVYEEPSCSLSAADALMTICDALDRGQFPYLHVDFFYVPGARGFGRYHWRHELLVTGVTDTGSFLCPTFGARGEFAGLEVPAANLAAAFCSPFGLAESFAYCRCSRIWALRTSERRDELRPDLIRAFVDDYLNSRNVASRALDVPVMRPWLNQYSKEIYESGVFGINCHDALAEFYHERIATGKEAFDARISRLFWEHKKLMGCRIDRLSRASVLNDKTLGLEWEKLNASVWQWHLHVVGSVRSRTAFDSSLFRKTISMLRSEEEKLLARLRSALN